jgi:arylsulfatase A
MSHANVLVILADDQGYGDLGCCGNPHMDTPHLDALADSGVLFTQHYAASAMCAPSRAGLLGGRYPHRTGALDVSENRGHDRISLDVPTIADAFRRAGYATGMAGKWHNGAMDRRFHPTHRGFDEFTGFCAGIMRYWDWIIEKGGVHVRSDGRYLTDVFTEEAVDFVHRHSREPFFYYLAYNAPHQPLEAPDEDIEHFRAMGKFTDAVCRLYAMLRRMDAGIGRVLDALREEGVLENTIILFTSDNGPVLAGTGEASLARYNGPFSGAKGDVLEGGIRVPAILSWPAGLDGGAPHGGMTHFCDWMPTLAAAADIPAVDPLQLDGVNLLPELRGEGLAANPQRFWHYNRYEPVPRSNAAMRDGDWKLFFPPIPESVTKVDEDNRMCEQERMHPGTYSDIVREPVRRVLSPPEPPRLFNLAEDPWEQNDRAKDEPERVAAMQRQWDSWFERVDAERRAKSEAVRGYPTFSPAGDESPAQK